MIQLAEFDVRVEQEGGRMCNSGRANAKRSEKINILESITFDVPPGSLAILARPTTDGHESTRIDRLKFVFIRGSKLAAHRIGSG